MDKRSQALIRDGARLTSLVQRAKERLVIATDQFKACCMDQDVAAMVLAREEVYNRNEALLDLIAQREHQRHVAEDYITNRGRLF